MELQEITTIKGKNPGKTVAIIAGIHGNEQGGLRAIEEAILSIPVENGTVHHIVGNPRALKQNVRFTEMNLNRAFIRGPLKNPKLENSYERLRAKELMPLLDTCDALLDIHSVAKQRSTPFIICEPSYFPIAKKLPFPIISNGWNTLEPGGTDYYMSTAGKIGICIECGQHTDPIVPKRALKGIRAFLQLMGNISGEPIPDTPNQKIITVIDILITKIDFKLAKDFYDFEPVTKGQLLGIDGQEEYKAPSNGVVIFARPVNTPDQEAIIFGEIQT